MSGHGPVQYLYRCFDREGQLLYVGVTDNVERRKREHAKDKFWWHDVTRVTRMAFQRRVEALWAEWAVISTCAPVYNSAATMPVAPDVPLQRPVKQPVRRPVNAGLRVVGPTAATDEQVALVESAHKDWRTNMPSARTLSALLGASSTTPGLNLQKALRARLTTDTEEQAS